MFPLKVTYTLLSLFVVGRKNASIAEIAVGLQKISYSWSGDLPPFVSDADLTADFGDLSVELDELVADPVDVVLECLRRAPTRRDVLGWMRENGIPERRTGRGNVDVPSPPAAREAREADFDEEPGDALRKHVVLRVRRNSDDSVGSELSCSQASQAEDGRRTGGAIG
jgi:hypothetical protein